MIAQFSIVDESLHIVGSSLNINTSFLPISSLYYDVHSLYAVEVFSVNAEIISSSAKCETH